MMKLDFTSTATSRRRMPSGMRVLVGSVAKALIFTFAVFIVFAVLLTYTPLPDTTIEAVVFVTTIFAVILAGIMVGRRATSRGWLSGAVSGLAYVLVLYIIGAVFVNDFVFDKNVFALAATGFLPGAFGGVVGINLKKN